MQCGCPHCGDLMAQVDQGMDSRCVCPACGFSCNACIGTGHSVQAPEGGRLRLSPEMEEYFSRLGQDDETE